MASLTRKYPNVPSDWKGVLYGFDGQNTDGIEALSQFTTESGLMRYLDELPSHERPSEGDWIIIVWELTDGWLYMGRYHADWWYTQRKALNTRRIEMDKKRVTLQLSQHDAHENTEEETAWAIEQLERVIHNWTPTSIVDGVSDAYVSISEDFDDGIQIVISEK